MGIPLHDLAVTETYIAAPGQTVFTLPCRLFPGYESAFACTVSGVAFAYDPVPSAGEFKTLSTGDEGVQIILGAACAGGESVHIYRTLPQERLSQLPENGPVSIKALNDELDRIVALIQDQQWVIDDADAVALSAKADAATAIATANSAAAQVAAAIIAAGSGAGLPVVTPESYGAVGDGVANDEAALSAASAAINALGGGVLWLTPGKTYAIGSHVADGITDDGNQYTFAPGVSYPIKISGTTRPVVVRGNGARIKCLDGLKYGAFNPDGSAKASASGYTGGDTLPGHAIASPYIAMIAVLNCTGPVHIDNVELDGNIKNLVIGGLWGTGGGRQLPASGVLLKGNTGSITTSNIYSHHHGLDGIIGDGPGLKAVPEDVTIHGRFLNNGRQGFSLTGGNGWHIADGSEFSGTGRDLGATMTYSPPGAGVDLEAEGGKWVRDISFGAVRCADNVGAGMVSDTNAFVEGVTFRGATFIGTTSWSIWPNNPRFVFEDCTIAGAFTRAYPSANPALATKFVRGLFTDDLAISPTGALYGGGSGNMGLDLGGGGQNIRFEDFHWKNVTPGRLIDFGNTGSTIDALAIQLHNNTLEKVAGAGGIGIYGIYSGERTTFINAVYLPSAEAAASVGGAYAGVSLDSFILNGTRWPANASRSTGKRIYRGSAVVDPASLAAGAKTAIATMAVAGVVLGDTVDEVSFSLNLAGVRVHAWVSAADTVSYYFVNENGANPLDLGSGTLRVTVNQS